MERKRLIDAIFDDMADIRRAMAGVVRHELGDRHVSPAQVQLLKTIQGAGQLSVKDAAELLQMTGSAITQLAEGLVAEGYLERRPAEHDRRVTYLVLTPAGEEYRTRLMEFWRKQIDPLMEALTDDDLADFHRIHRKLLARITERYEDTSKKTKE